jgi:hypothetical protein
VDICFYYCIFWKFGCNASEMDFLGFFGGFMNLNIMQSCCGKKYMLM